MSERAPYQVLVFPYFKSKEQELEYCIFRRKDMGAWQGVAGGGEVGETPLESAKRETFEEAGITSDNRFVQLSSISSVPVEAISGFIWGEDVLVIPEYSFAVRVKSKEIHLKDEHSKFEWLNFDEAMGRLEWDSNRSALWELNHRLTKNKLSNIKNVT